MLLGVLFSLTNIPVHARRLPSSEPVAPIPPPLVEDERQFFLPGEPHCSKDFRVSNFSLPHSTNTQLHFAWDFNECDGRDCYMTGMRVLLNPVTFRFIHHYVIRVCSGSVNPSLNGLPVTDTSVMEDCNPINTWTPGNDIIFKAPLVASRQIGHINDNTGANTNHQFVVRSLTMQIHYSNPALVMGLVDTSGLRMFYTTVPRRFSVGQVNPIVK